MTKDEAIQRVGGLLSNVKALSMVAPSEQELYVFDTPIDSNHIIKSIKGPVYFVLQTNDPGDPPEWAFFLDKDPAANWEHPCAYILVHKSGTFTVAEETAPPDFDLASQMKRVEPLEHPIEFEDRRAAANSYRQADKVAQHQRQFAELTQTFIASDDRHDAIRDQLRMMYRKRQDQRQFGEQDRRTSAITYHQLGRVAQEQRQFAEAEVAYKKALRIFHALDDRLGAAGTYHQLGVLLLEQGKLAEAEDACRKALATFDDLWQQVTRLDEHQSATSG